ncbi:hypothetical protein [Anaerocolumna sp. MB42-C2]|uniref:hypothetical protein n=1 Tax=Anaerocolumna sp. MB42-C2 TaxID=3070997 RepID=UPI0027E01F01|nr:hypothetical protein [Anaerocolumna sp. MB42-C2]WMJ85808.1 hypothetical protein RBU59_17270 [Anaerocolumna sp. MB42-C2]
MKVNHSLKKKLLSCIFSFMLSLSFTTLFVLIGLQLSVFNDRLILDKINESGYYYEVQKELDNSASSIIMNAGMPTELLYGVITLERVYLDGRTYMEEALADKTAVPDTEKLTKVLKQNIEEYLNRNSIHRTEELDAGIDALISSVKQEYKRVIEFRFIRYLGEYKVYYRNIMIKAFPIALCLVIFLSGILIRMHRYRHRGVRYITYALTASSLSIGGLACYLLITKAADRRIGTPDYYHRFLSSYLRGNLQVFLYLSGFGILLSIFLIILTGYLKKQYAD